MGTIACCVDANGQAVMLWQVDERDVSWLAIHDDTDSAALFEWWQVQQDARPAADS